LPCSLLDFEAHCSEYVVDSSQVYLRYFSETPAETHEKLMMITNELLLIDGSEQYMEVG